MQLNITGHHVDMTDSMKTYVETKMEKIERHFDNVTNVHVILSVEKQGHKAEATIHVTGANIFAESKNDDMYAAIDAMVDKLDRQVKKHKEKQTDHHRNEGSIKKLMPEE